VSKTAKPAQASPKKHDELLALTDRAQKGDKTALPELRELLKEPAAVDLLGGDLAKQAQLILINKFSGQNLLFRESLTRKLELLRAELAGPNPAPLERLLVERIVACWLHLHHLEANYAGKENMSLELGSYYQRSISSAQKRYLAAIKTLALVRKLAVPVLQVNIARKQVNVAGSCVAADSERGTPRTATNPMNELPPDRSRSAALSSETT
jgi:hypothetical protein